MFSRLKALQLLSKCRGDEIWPVDLCEQEGVPAEWISELADTNESGFNTDRETIYLNDRVTNQFHGVEDLKLAFKLGEFLGIDTNEIYNQAFGRVAMVIRIKEAVEES